MGTIRYQIVDIDGKEIIEEIHKIVVYNSEIISSWEGIELGHKLNIDSMIPWSLTDECNFVKKYGKNIDIHYFQNPQKLTMEVKITAELELKKLTEYYLKWGKKWK